MSDEDVQSSEESELDGIGPTGLDELEEEEEVLDEEDLSPEGWGGNIKEE